MSVFILEITLLYCLSYLYKDNSMFLPHPKEHMAPPEIDYVPMSSQTLSGISFFTFVIPGLTRNFHPLRVSPQRRPSTTILYKHYIEQYMLYSTLYVYFYSVFTHHAFLLYLHIIALIRK